MKSKIPYLIAEISANHCGSIKRAKKLISTAKKYGADAVKLQTYTPSTMTLNSKNKYFKISKGLWKGYYLWDLYNKAQTPFKWHKELFSYAKKKKIKIFSTPFDESAVDFLEKLNCPMYKVSSFEILDLQLIKKIAKTKKPIIISTGTASLEEIKLAYNQAKKFGSKDITLLYCVSNYPSSIKDFNIYNIKILKRKFKCRVGLSDHSTDNKIAISAIISGAEVIEKHIALDNQRKGFDIDFSLKGKEIAKFKKDITEAYLINKKKFFYRSNSEKQSKMLRRSIFASQEIKKNEKFTENNIKRVRPGNGISPQYFKFLLNKKSPFKIKKNSPINKKVLKKIIKN